MDILHKIFLRSWETIKALGFISFQSALQLFRDQSPKWPVSLDQISDQLELDDGSLTFMHTVVGNTIYNKVCLYASSMFYSSYVKQEPTACFSNKKIIPCRNANYYWKGSSDSFGRRCWNGCAEFSVCYTDTPSARLFFFSGLCLLSLCA